jgi:hypothetical protein
MYGHDSLACTAADNDMRALLPQLAAATLPEKPEQILAGQTSTLGLPRRNVKSLDSGPGAVERELWAINCDEQEHRVGPSPHSSRSVDRRAKCLNGFQGYRPSAKTPTAFFVSTVSASLWIRS